MKIVIPDYIDIPDSYKSKIEALGGSVFNDLPETNAGIIDRIKDAEVITANYFDVTPEIIDAAPLLKYIICPAVGYDWIDVDYAKSKGIQVLNCPTFVSLTVAEHVIALIFSLAHRITEADRDIKSGLWNPAKYVGVQVSGKRLGLVGYGNIGKRIEPIAKSAGLEVVSVNSKSTPEELEHLLKTSDFVCICVPLSAKTKHMISADLLKLLKKSAFLINVSRGAVVDQKALIQALKNKEFAGAGLDVYEGEPPSIGNTPAEILELVNLDGVIATPHSAFNTPDTLERKGEELYQNIKDCLADTPLNKVN